ncbi:hypothetical protein [Sorangium sp. So ce341]|uniref:hypothetical protein n=1 Tax=Sorangium sp. So ce341 TaxID=3133302 RepID=UPI003F5F7A18
MHGALLRAGVAACDALRWLDERREDGLRSRFTLAESARREVLMEAASTSLPPHLRTRRRVR